MNLGIMQGRLSEPVDGHMQEFPTNWQNEFKLLQDCGLNHIEWLITKGSATTNPAFDSNICLKQYPISSFCADTLVDTRIVDKNYLNQNLRPICESAIRNNVKIITIPLLEDSSVEESKIRNKFKDLIVEYGKQYPTLMFSFECELSIEALQEIIQLSDNFYVTYDTGNITSYGIDHTEYIAQFYHRINNVHLKDRTYTAKTVEPSTGDTNFSLIFKNLSSLGYNGVYTMQTARGKVGDEFNTALSHKKILKEIYDAK
ncbi:MAG: hypothetical protein CMF74_05110 [Maricaulis sp.]|nr:hypothetical protein [Maricaulis sp.]